MKKTVLFLHDFSSISNKAYEYLRSKDCNVITPNKNQFMFEEQHYDIGIGFLYPYKIPQQEVENKLWINFHPGPLPEMGGRNLAYNAIIEGRKQFGATIHIMDKDFDRGKIIETVRFNILQSMVAEDLTRISRNFLISFSIICLAYLT